MKKCIYPHITDFQREVVRRFYRLDTLKDIAEVSGLTITQVWGVATALGIRRRKPPWRERPMDEGDKRTWRKREFRHMGLEVDTYLHPKDATLDYLMVTGRVHKINIEYRDIEHVQGRAQAIFEMFPRCIQTYITISSKI